MVDSLLRGRGSLRPSPGASAKRKEGNEEEELEGALNMEGNVLRDTGASSTRSARSTREDEMPKSHTGTARRTGTPAG